MDETIVPEKLQEVAETTNRFRSTEISHIIKPDLIHTTINLLPYLSSLNYFI